MYYECRVWEGLEFIDIYLLNMGMLPQGVCRTGVKCVTNTQCSRYRSTWMSYLQTEKQYGDIATTIFDITRLSKEVTIFEESTSSYLAISSHLLEHNRNSGENWSYHHHYEKKKNPLIPSDYWPQNSHLHTVLDHKLWFTHIQHIHEWAVTVCTKLKSVAYAACGRTKITMCHCSSASDNWTPLLLSCGKWITSPFYGEEVKDVVEGSTNPAIHPLLLQNYKFMSE